MQFYLATTYHQMTRRVLVKMIWLKVSFVKITVILKERRNLVSIMREEIVVLVKTATISIRVIVEQHLSRPYLLLGNQWLVPFRGLTKAISCLMVRVAGSSSLMVSKALLLLELSMLLDLAIFASRSEMVSVCS